MQIQLNQEELEQAVRLFVESQGISLADCDVDVSFTAGRGAQGTTASIDICKKRAQQPKPAKPTLVANTAKVEEPVTEAPAPAQKVEAAPVEEAAEETVEEAPEEPASTEPDITAGNSDNVPFEPDTLASTAPDDTQAAVATKKSLFGGA
ncbi:hypothetical protein [Larsenimonas suaedae]|uniref:Uncharacterized protein n=1 Tax=Larsenimonas suaedae TaxID=1851019 RepID=A0ABU1H1B5_9GAMM|nr:hypothetical protein [Larsenimonas suaedae]MCM2973804.1 hypothetical protein [Larsenimonas suaedae]MDR5897328.1 hypothetical protein [Larsenimonas suaedae]